MYRSRLRAAPRGYSLYIHTYILSAGLSRLCGMQTTLRSHHLIYAWCSLYRRWPVGQRSPTGCTGKYRDPTHPDIPMSIVPSCLQVACPAMCPAPCTHARCMHTGRPRTPRPVIERHACSSEFAVKSLVTPHTRCRNGMIRASVNWGRLQRHLASTYPSLTSTCPCQTHMRRTRRLDNVASVAVADTLSFAA